MKLFRKKHTAEETDIVYEKWSTSFMMLQEHRFQPESGAGYESAIGRGGLALAIDRRNLFAWTDDPLYRYENFLLSAELELDSSNGYSSAGFLFRRLDNSSYYYFLVSGRGFFRLDSVMNGSPEPLIDWTPLSDFNPERFRVELLADGSSLTLFVNEAWAGSVKDERLVAGGLSFAAQNYDEKSEAHFRLRKIAVESRPLELEKRISKIRERAVAPEARIRFAESQMRSGRAAAALIELRKAVREDGGNADLLVTAADCSIRLGLYEEAARFLDEVPEAARSARHLMCRAGMLYLSNDFIALKKLLGGESSGSPAGGAESPAARNLLGNAEFALGNWAAAADAYLAAAGAEPSEPLYRLNAARALEKSGKRTDALDSYSRAARMYFRDGSYEELLAMLPFIEKLDAESQEARSIKAKILFSGERFAEAEKLFSKLIKEDCPDSGVYYLSAVIAGMDGKKRKVSSLLKKAVELEPDYYLYHFKKAESAFLSGGRYRAELDEALRLAPEDPWVLNLAGLAALSGQDAPAAADFFSAALGSAPSETEILVNYSEALFLAGRRDEAFAVLDSEEPPVLNQKGNLHARLGDYNNACLSYEEAYSAAPTDSDIMLNLAAACIESDLYSRAEEVLIRVLEAGERAQAYNLVGNLALLKGESGRAEAAYTRALELDPAFADAVCNLAEFYLSRERLNEADMLLGRLEAGTGGERAADLESRVFRKRMQVFSCGGCGREWAVPRKIADQGALRLVGEPPDDMPAGKCSGCGEIYCIGCAKGNLENGRFICASCGSPLKLNENWMRYLYQVNMLDK